MPKSHTISEWILATRPWSFPASVMPVGVTLCWILCRQDHLDTPLTTSNWLLGLWALLNIVVVHAAGNVWSDIFDYRKGVDAPDTYGVRILTDGTFEPRQLLRLSLGLQLIAVAGGVALVMLTGLPLLLVGACGIALSLLYPPLKYSALGDVVIMLCYALLPTLGTTFIVTGRFMPEILWLAVPIGSITVAILHVNNTRDIETDRRAGIRTIAMLTGRSAAAAIYVAEVILPYLWLPSLCIMGVAPWTALLSLASLPLAIGNARTMLSCKTRGIAAIARLDERTAQLQLAFSLLLMAGLALSLWV